MPADVYVYVYVCVCVCVCVYVCVNMFAANVLTMVKSRLTIVIS